MITFLDFINNLCKLLDIPKPKISYDTSHFPNATTLAQCSSDGTTIYLKEIDSPDLEYFFAIAHELRHIWQIIKYKETYLSKYKPRNCCKSLNDYAIQIAEVDSNAFAGVIMVDCFGIKPLFNGYSQTVKDAIYNRMEHLVASL